MMKTNKVTLLLSAAILVGCGGSSNSNTAPVFNSNNYQIQLDEDNSATLQVSASDQDTGDTVSYSLANASANAVVEINTSTGLISYTPHANFNGPDSFEISASDGEANVSTAVNVTVNAVNDAPTLTANEIIVSGGEIKKGTVQAQDVEDDTLTYSIVETTENGQLDIDGATGEVTYTPTGLVNLDDTFTLKVTDGQGGELVKALTIQASLATNTDRAYYYYASEHSRLKQAENLIRTVSDDINQGLIFANLANGYAEAGLVNEVAKLVSEEQIVRAEQRARALLNASFIYNGLGLLDMGDEYRALASSLYTEYVASKGISAFDADDALFFTNLAASYNQVNNTEQANQTLAILDTLFNSALDGNATTAALRTFFAYSGLVESAIEDWQSSLTQADYDLAHSMTERMYGYANLISHRYVSNDRNGNEGKEYHSTRQVALAEVVTAFMELNDFDNAKEALHDVFALHGVVGVDEDYPRTASPFAEVTKVEYEYGLYGVIEEFVVLYPETTLDTYLTGFPEGSFWALFAEEDAADARLMANVRNMEDKDAALALVVAEKDPENLRNHFTNLVAFNSARPGGAIYLRKQGEYEAAGKFLTEALNLLKTDEYVAENLSTEPFVTGQTGCQIVVEEYLALYNITQNEAFKAQAQTAIDTCIDIAATHYVNGSDGTDVSIAYAIQANSRFLAFASQLDIEDKVESILTTVEENVQKINENAFEEIFTQLRGIGIALANGHKFTQAQGYYNRAIVQLNKLEAVLPVEEQGQETSAFFDNGLRSSSDYNDFLTIIERQAGTLDNYVEIKTAAQQAWRDVIDARMATLATQADQQKLTFLPLYASQLIRLGSFDDALAIANNDVFGVVEKDAIKTAVATGLSLYDDFKQTLVASVDTDGDGKANFFLEGASDQAIANSGIVLDEDSDNDGVNDEEDAFPLDATKQ